ncbi:hypothetical protein [Mesorhizobium sp. M1378]|uniref:hypothetical protein n=1 Tax=Mesorhizobium sp. M1378 TaxID=2957092 RepID=UPI0033398242
MEWWQRLKKRDQENFRLFTRFRSALEVIAAATTWQSLRSIGSSRILSLTIAVPFIGYLIIFNDHLIDYAKIARQLLSDGRVATPEDQNSISLSNLYYLYFGLVLTGFGSLLFAVFCPSDIRQSGSLNEYIRRSEEIKSPTLVSDHLNDVMTAYNQGLEQVQGDDTAIINIRTYLTYPSRLSSLHYNLVHRIFEEHPDLYGQDERDASKTSDERSETEHETLEFDSEYDSVAEFPFNHGTEHLDVDSVSNVIVSGPSAFRHFVKEFRKYSSGSFKDVCLLRYQILDNSTPYTRITIAIFYFSGFFLLFVPTLETLYLVLSALTTA